jgi:hypothetical protein
LLSYGPSRIFEAKRLAAYVQKILNGAKPADLPGKAAVANERLATRVSPAQQNWAKDAGGTSRTEALDNSEQERPPAEAALRLCVLLLSDARDGVPGSIRSDGRGRHDGPEPERRRDLYL